MIEPDTSWHWQLVDNQLLLCGTSQRQPVTAVNHCGWLFAEPEFTLEHAQWYYECWYALAELSWPDHVLFAATTDAIALLAFSRGILPRNFYLQAWGEHQCQIQPWQLVEVCGQHPALALVLRVHPNDVDLMLLTPLQSISGKSLSHGQTLNCRFDRLRPYLLKEAPSRLRA